jgi:hypothetical protein
LLLNLRKGSLQDEVNGFWEVLTGQPLATGVSAAALCKARQKLDPYALWGLNERLLGAFAEAFPVRRWHGLRVLATDGSTLRLPRSPEVIAHFGAPPSGSTIPLGRLSQLVDVLNGVVVDAELDAYDVGERVLASEHLEATAPQDLVLYDRGYPAFWLFCPPLPTGTALFAPACRWASPPRSRPSWRAGARSAVITLTPTPEARQPCRRYEIPPDPLHVRLVRVTLANGETEVLATSLLSEQDWPSPWFKGLYHLRWGGGRGLQMWQAPLGAGKFLRPQRPCGASGLLCQALYRESDRDLHLGGAGYRHSTLSSAPPGIPGQLRPRLVRYEKYGGASARGDGHYRTADVPSSWRWR